MCRWSVNILNAITTSMSHSIQSQSYLVPGVHSEGKKVVTGQGVFMPMTAFWNTFPWPWGYVFGAKNHVLMLHSLCGYRDRTEWLLSSVVNSSRNVVFALLNHPALQQCNFFCNGRPDWRWQQKLYTWELLSFTSERLVEMQSINKQAQL